MEWYFGNDIEDLVVPNDEEIFDWIPFPESWTFGWSPWTKLVGSPKNFITAGIQEPLSSVTAFSGEVEQLSASSVCQGSKPVFHQSAYSFEPSDVQLNDISRLDEADDIFLYKRRSLLEEDVSGIDGADSSANFMQTSIKEDVVPVVHVLGGGEHVQDHISIVEKSMNLKKQAFSASLMFNDGEYDSPFPLEKALAFEIPASLEHSDVLEHFFEDEILLGESVLLELQRSTLQLAERTRISFRDALYRLAENSRTETSYHQNGKKARLGEPEAKESSTNTIDRTVATLLFNTKKLCNHAATSTSILTKETSQNKHQENCCLYQSRYSTSSYCAVSEGDAEVPTFDLQNHLMSP